MVSLFIILATATLDTQRKVILTLFKLGISGTRNWKSTPQTTRL